MSSNSAWCRRGVAFVITMMLTLAVIAAAPVESDEEVSGNGLGVHGEADDLISPWDGLDAQTLRKILLQIEADERVPYAPRALRSWSPLETRGWAAGGPRGLDSRAVRQWRADKRQVRFRQCYFNPISCFRK